MEVQDIHVGSQLHVCSSIGGEALGVYAPGIRDPISLGIGWWKRNSSLSYAYSGTFSTSKSITLWLNIVVIIPFLLVI